MTTRRPPVGRKLKAWAERRCSPDTVASIVMPAIADLQYEDAASAGRPAIARWSVRLRGYVAFGKAIGLHCLQDRRPPVTARKLAPSPAAGGGVWSSIMSEPKGKAILVGAGLVVAVVAFAAGRLSAPAPAPAAEVREVSSAALSDDYPALRRSFEDERREAAERDRKIQQELAQQRYDLEMERAKAERARIDAETELARQRTQEMIDALDRRR